MSRKFISLIIFMFLLTSVSGVISSIKTPIYISNEQRDESDFSHTVFAGVAFTQGCETCHYWNQDIYDTYDSGEFDFQYASMIVYDKNGDVLIREAYDWDSNYSIITYPTSIFDGDYLRITGYHPEFLNDTLNDCGNRTVSDINANLTISWQGNATINITATIENNGTSDYNGTIKAFITEITSRYDTSEGDPYHFGFLSFGMDENISIDSGDTYSNSAHWNGYEHEDEHGNDFGDINAHNIKIILVIYNETSGFVDDSVSAVISNNPPYEPSNPYPADGSTGVDVNIDLSWICSDPEEDPLTYDIYFGETNPPPKIADNYSNSTFDPDMLNITTVYYWKIVAWDNYDAFNEGPIWSFKTRLNNPPATPDTPVGPSEGSKGVKYSFTTRTTDPDNDQVFYKWDWGDGNYSDWLGPFIQGQEASGEYTWNKSGDFLIKVKAKDIVNSESNWSSTSTIHIVKPEIGINKIKGGISKIKVTIRNDGDGEASNINWRINLVGGFVLRGFESTGTIQIIPPGDQVNITSNRIFGLGRTDVVVTLEQSGEQIDKKTENGLILLFFIRV